MKNLQEAVNWDRKSSRPRSREAQRNLGVCLAIGAGVDQDPVEAAKWYRKAADQGDVGAQYNLGVAYYKGQGVLKMSLKQ